jgi:hypothetical protein
MMGNLSSISKSESIIMFNIFASLIGSTRFSARNKLPALPVVHEEKIQDLAQEERSAVAGGPQLDNDPEA